MSGFLLLFLVVVFGGLFFVLVLVFSVSHSWEHQKPKIFWAWCPWWVLKVTWLWFCLAGITCLAKLSSGPPPVEISVMKQDRRVAFNLCCTFVCAWNLLNQISSLVLCSLHWSFLIFLFKTLMIPDRSPLGAMNEAFWAFLEVEISQQMQDFFQTI